MMQARLDALRADLQADFDGRIENILKKLTESK